MSLIDTKKEMGIKQANDYIIGLCDKCPELADIAPTEMYDLPDWELSIEKYEKELRIKLNKWKELYEQTRTS